MYDLIPFILEQEKDKIQSEIKDKHLSIVFDGTSRLGEVLAIIHYVDNWEVKQRLVRLGMLTKSITAEELARELINVLSVSYGIKSHLLVASMRDGASINEAAMRVAKVVYNEVLDVRCFFHTLDIIGEKFKLPFLMDFSTAWISLFSHSPKTKALWKEQTGRSMASLSKTRWWSRWEIYKQLLLQFGDIMPFLQNHTDIGASLRPKMLAMLSDSRNLGLLQMELATVVDVGECFVSRTYKLEGDGLLAITCFEEIVRVRTSLTVGHYPNMTAISNRLAAGNPIVAQQWMKYGMDCVQPGIDYFHSKFGNDCSPPLNAFKAARLASPLKVNDLKPVAADIDSLKCIPVLNKSETIENLKKELPTYLAKTNGISTDVDALDWFRRNEGELPYWSAAFKLLALIQPSSAAAERIFSLLNASFSSCQTNSLEDYVE